MIRTGQFVRVRFSQVEEYHLAGWMVVAEDQWGALMWRCDCEEPK